MPKKIPKKSRRVGGRPQVREHPDDLTPDLKSGEIHKSLVDLSKEEAKEMSAWVKLRVDDARGSKVWQETKERIRTLREAYEHGVARTTTEMRGAHDYRTKIAAAQCDGLISRVLSIFSTDPILKFEGRNPIGLQNARNVELFMDHHHDVNVKLPQRADEIASDIVIEGHCVLYTPWAFEIQKDKPTLVRKQAYVGLDGKEVLVDMEDAIAISKVSSAGAVPKLPETVVVSTEKKTTVTKNHPDLMVFSLLDYLCPADGKPGLDRKPAWEAVRIPFTMDDLEKMNEDGQIYKGVLKEIKNYLIKHPLEMEKPSGSTGQVTEGSEEPLDKEALDSVLPCWVIWGKQKVPGKKGLQDAATIYHEDSGWVLQTRLIPNIDTSPPMFHLRLLQVPWRMAGMGVMEMAMDGERAINDLANYILDEGRIFSCLPYIYNKKKFPGGIPPFEFWKGLGVQGMNDIKELNFRDRRPMDMNVAGFIRANTERRTGQGDLQLGRESDITGKQPPTARGIMTILREGVVRYTKINFGIINELVRMGQFVVNLYQQFLPSNTTVEILGEDRQNVFPNGVSRAQIFGSYLVTANMAAQQMARELDAELNIQLYQLFQTNPFIAKSMSAFYDMTVDVLHSVGKKKLWVKPLSFYQQTPEGAQGQAGPGGQRLTPQEQQFVQELLQAGLDPEEVRAQLENLRSGVEPGAGLEGLEAEQRLLTAGEAA